MFVNRTHVVVAAIMAAVKYLQTADKSETAATTFNEIVITAWHNEITELAGTEG